jgi:YD repeat-containing protein
LHSCEWNLIRQYKYLKCNELTVVLSTGQEMVTRYEYDEAGNELAQIDALNRTNSYAYDSLGRRIRHALPGGQVEGFAFDLGGNLVAKRISTAW